MDRIDYGDRSVYFSETDTAPETQTESRMTIDGIARGNTVGEVLA